VLLERIVLNLVSNAVRYTTSGGIVVGCHRRGGKLVVVIDNDARVLEGMAGLLRNWVITKAGTAP
jgi:signal transduction histidine kinase